MKNNNIKHYHIINLNEHQFVLDTYNMVLCEFDTAHINVLENINMNDDILSNRFNIPINEIGEIRMRINMLLDKGLFISKISMPSLPLDNTVGYISITPVHICNLQCKYCFADHGNNYKLNNKFMDKEKINVSLNILYRTVFKDAKKIRIDFVGGGEPFLNINIIAHIIDETSRLDKKYKKETFMWICSNGTLMSDKILKIIDNPKVNLGISIDGNREQHNAIRKYMDGTDTYDTIINNIDYIRNNSVNRNLKSIWGLVVITAQTKSLVNILIHHKNIGFSSIQMKLVRLGKDHPLSINKNNISHIKNLYDELAEYLIKEIKLGDIQSLKMILNNNDYLGKIIKRLLMGARIEHRCFAGKNKVSLTANGDVFPCDSFVGIDEFKLFNIDEVSDNYPNNIFRKMSVHNRSQSCNRCWAKYICGGDCPHNSYVVNKNIFEPDSCFCEIQYHLIMLSLKILLAIYQNKYIEVELKKFILLREKIGLFNV